MPGVAPLRPPPRGRRFAAVSAALVAAVVATALTVVSSPDATAGTAAISPTGWNTVASQAQRQVRRRPRGRYGERHRRPAVRVQQQHRAAVAVPADLRRLRADQRAQRRDPGAGRQQRLDRRRRADPLVGLRQRQQPAVPPGRGGRRRVPPRQPQQRQVPRRTVRVGRGQRPAAAVHLQRQRRPIVQDQPCGRHASDQPARYAGPRPERVGLRPVDACQPDPEPPGPGVQPAGGEPVRRAAVRPPLQARHLQRQRERRLLHPGRGPRPDPGQREHQRRRARRGRLVPAAERDPQLLARRRGPARSPRPAGSTAGRSARRRRTGGCI